MRRFRCLLHLALLLVPVTPAAAMRPQGGGGPPVVIESIAIETPFPFVTADLKHKFRQDLKRLPGQIYDAAAIDRLADRISEHLLPDYVFAAYARVLPGAQPDHVQVIVFVSSYSIESARIEGPAESAVSSTMRAAIQNLAGQQFDESRVKWLQDQITDELKPNYAAVGLVHQGAARQQVQIIFATYTIALLPFRGTDFAWTYRVKQGYSVAFPLVIWCGGAPRKQQLSLITMSYACGEDETAVATLRLAYNRDDLIERYFGGGLKLESVHLGTSRLGARVEFTSYGVTWAEETVRSDAALPAASRLYRRRQTVEPSVAVVFTRGAYATTGFRWSSLAMRSPGAESRSANAAVSSIRYRSPAEALGTLGEHLPVFNDGYDMHAGAPLLGGSFSYTRHLWDARYTRSARESAVSVAIKAGRITGNAPLFERFSLGNIETLRGWRKFDIAPSGGSRMAHGSLEYNVFDDSTDFFGMHVFVDAGAVWDAGEPVRWRGSAGVGLGMLRAGFVQVAIPIGSPSAGGRDFYGFRGLSAPMITLGIRAGMAQFLHW